MATYCRATGLDGAMNYALDKLGFVDGFKNKQSVALKSFLRGHDLFVSLPTGFGKSVIFQVAPLCVDFLRGQVDADEQEGVTLDDVSNKPTRHAVAVIVMPLKALITDQLSRAKELHIDAADVSGGITDDIRKGICSAKYSLLFASPESLLGDAGHELFNISAIKEQLCGLFIDESHCVSKW